MAIQASDIVAVMKEAGIDNKIITGINPAQPFLKQGIDSIDLPIIASAAEAKFGIDLSNAKASNLGTLNDFAAYVNQLIAKK